VSTTTSTSFTTDSNGTESASITSSAPSDRMRSTLLVRHMARTRAPRFLASCRAILPTAHVDN
jgi:hypothetical protein